MPEIIKTRKCVHDTEHKERINVQKNCLPNDVPKGDWLYFSLFQRTS